MTGKETHQINWSYLNKRKTFRPLSEQDFTPQPPTPVHPCHDDDSSPWWWSCLDSWNNNNWHREQQQQQQQQQEQQSYFQTPLFSPRPAQPSYSWLAPASSVVPRLRSSGYKRWRRRLSELILIWSGKPLTHTAKRNTAKQTVQIFVKTFKFLTFGQWTLQQPFTSLLPAFLPAFLPIFY